MSLSDKIKDIPHNWRINKQSGERKMEFTNYEEAIRVKDVKEAVRELKERLLKEFSSEGGMPEESYESLVKKIIDEIFGEKLK